MKRHSLTSYKIGICDSWIGFVKVIPKSWELLLVPIKGYHRKEYDAGKIMLLQGELYFIVEEEFATYDYPRKKKTYRLTWDELIRLVETTPWSKLTHTYSRENNRNWKALLLKSIANALKHYDPIEEAKWRNRPQLTDANIAVLCKIVEAETKGLEKLVNKIYGY